MGKGKSRQKQVGGSNPMGESEPQSSKDSFESLDSFPAEEGFYKSFAELVEGVELEQVSVGWDSINERSILGDYIYEGDIHEKIVPYVYGRWGEKGVVRLMEYMFRRDYEDSMDVSSLGTTKYSGEFVSSALNYWSSGFVRQYGSTSIRRSQFSKDDVKDGNLLKNKLFAKSLESFISEKGSVTSEPLYRGVVSDLGFSETLVKGATIDLRGISSWSGSRYVAQKFSQNYSRAETTERLIFVIPKGVKAASISKDSHYSSEQESIVSKNVKPKVRNVSKGTGELEGITIVELEV